MIIKNIILFIVCCVFFSCSSMRSKEAIDSEHETIKQAFEANPASVGR
jgi:hypothetical protein